MTFLPTSSSLADGFTPHGFCLSWQPSVLALHIVSDAVIAFSYYSIPLTLARLFLGRRDLIYGWTLLLFAAFIVACGTTHLMEIWTLWHADYVAQGILKAVTAAISLLTAVLIWPIIPRLLRLPSATSLTEANQHLAAQIREKEAALDSLRREVHERERAEAMLRHAQKLQAIGQLTAGIAHDFNNLLLVAQGNLELLQRRLTESPLARHVDRTIAAIGRASAVTYQLLAFARLQPLQPTAIDVNARVRGLSELLPRTVSERARLVFDLASDLWHAEADAAQLDAALMNLALNAGHAMPEGGQLLVRTANLDLSDDHGLVGEIGRQDAEPGSYVLVSVTDTGVGMTPDVREKAFDPFFTTKTAGIGTGLGLSQIYGFIKQSRGRIGLQSEPGQGTVVTLLLRRAVVADVTLAAPADTGPGAGAAALG